MALAHQTPRSPTAGPPDGADARHEVAAAMSEVQDHLGREVLAAVVEHLESLAQAPLGALVGIRGTSIHEHVANKAAVEDALVTIGSTEQADAVQGVPTTSAAVASAYRGWALAHPHAHRLLNDRPITRSQLPDGLEERAAAPLIAACDGDLALARAAWATIKGLVDLELASRSPPWADLDAVYAAAARADTSAAPVQTWGQVTSPDRDILSGRGVST